MQSRGVSNPYLGDRKANLAKVNHSTLCPAEPLSKKDLVTQVNLLAGRSPSPPNVLWRSLISSMTSGDSAPHPIADRFVDSPEID